MCGIVGFYGEGDLGALRQMSERLAHRGPDGQGELAAAGLPLFLAHRRLAILDLADGAQPMSSSCGGFTIVFNGEIYNHRELRAELEQRGRRFHTGHSDTEVILNGYAEWGAGVVERLNGQWAFVIHDRDRRRLFGSRDRFGEKPFFYHHRRGLFAFASEATAFFAHPAIPRELSTDGLQRYFAFGYVPAPRSAFRDIHKLPAGHNFTFDLDRDDLSVERYWEYRVAPDHGHPDRYWIELLAERLSQAVARQLAADVPVGTFLSGGLDSSIITVLAAERTGADRLDTYAIGFREASFDESAYARLAAERLGIRHHPRTADSDELGRLLEEAIPRLDEPMADSSFVPTFLLCRHAREGGVKVALSGDGADELFGGYDTFKAIPLGRLYRRLTTRWMRDRLAGLFNALPAGVGYMSLEQKLKRALTGFGYPPPLWNPTWLAPLAAAEIAELLGTPTDPETLYAEAIACWESSEAEDDLGRASEFYVRFYLQNGILAKTDRASMLNGLEVRAPFLDREVADVAARIPSRLKLRRGIGKYALRRAFAGRLPAEVVRRRKHGFAMPVSLMYRSGALDLDPARIAPPCDRGFVERRLAAHRRGERDDRLYLWAQDVLDRINQTPPANTP